MYRKDRKGERGEIRLEKKETERMKEG